MTKNLQALLLALWLIFCCSLPAAAGPAAPELHAKAAEKKELNGDTVGWLQVPGTTIDDVILWYPDDQNGYYLRRNFERKSDRNGSYFADYRCRFDEGMSRNTVIYGNSFPGGQAEELFGQLGRFRDEAFCRENPYIYFADTERTMKWEVFAVSVMDVTVPYNNPNPDDEQLAEIIEKARASSLHSFDSVSVGVQDTLLTLSTVDYSKTAAYLNDNRFVVMAKLVEPPAEGAQPELSQPAQLAAASEASQPQQADSHADLQ